jgi:hypothetical protein
MIDKFQYPIFPDRMYTITFEDKEYQVIGAVLIALYAKYGDLNTLAIQDK